MPEAVPANPPTCPFHPTLLSQPAPSSDLAVIDVAEQCMLFFVEIVQQIDICQRDNVDAGSEIQFAMSGIASPVQPTMLWHLVNTATAWRSPRRSEARVWSITCPCDCKVCLLVCLLSLWANWTKSR